MIEPEELKEYITSVSKVIIEATPEGFMVKESIKFDLAVINTQEDGGKISIKIAKYGQVTNKEVISRVKFEFHPIPMRGLPTIVV